MPLSQQTIEGLRASNRKDLEAAQLLERAALRVERGWTRTFDAINGEHCEVPPWHPDAACYCMRGAIQRATLELGFVTVASDPYEGEQFLRDVTPDAASVRARAYGAAAHVILGQAPAAMSNLPHIVTHWNDTTALSGQSVARKLRDAAGLVRLRIADVQRGLREGR